MTITPGPGSHLEQSIVRHEHGEGGDHSRYTCIGVINVKGTHVGLINVLRKYKYKYQNLSCPAPWQTIKLRGTLRMDRSDPVFQPGGQ